MQARVLSAETDSDRDAATRTPELCTCAIGSEVNKPAQVATGAPLFSLFRPKKQRKVRVHQPHGIAVRLSVWCVV